VSVTPGRPSDQRRAVLSVPGAGQTQRLGDRGRGGGLSDHGDRRTAAQRPAEPFDAVAGETFVVVDAPQRFRRERFEVGFEEGLQAGRGGQQPVHHIQGEQGEPQETGEVVGAEGAQGHEDAGHSLG